MDVTKNMNIFKLLVIVGVVVLFSTKVNASVLTFDDIAPTGFIDTVYKDFTLTDGAIGDWNTSYGINTAYSGTQSLVNHNGNNIGQLSINSGTFDFNGAYFHQDNRYGARTVNIFGLDSFNNILFSDSLTATSSWVYHGLNWTGISKFKWSVAGGNSNIGIDDFSYNISAVPVPAAAWLFGSALLGFFGFSRKKANA